MVSWASAPVACHSNKLQAFVHCPGIDSPRSAAPLSKVIDTGVITR